MSSVEKFEIEDTDLSRPNIPLKSHPIYDGRYIIPTNEIDRFYQKVCQCIENRSPGAIIFGRPRLGKSRAIKYLSQTLPNIYSQIPIYFIKCRKKKNPNEETFYGDILYDIGHSIPYSGKAPMRFDRLLKYLITNSRINNQNRIVFFLDDAHRLHEIQYDWLMDIFNELDDQGISLTCFLVGQEELVQQRNTFVELGKNQIIGRFMVQQYKFSGIKTKNDLHECLAGYDDYSEHPLNSGWSFTKYFFPIGYSSGFRLQNYSETLFEIFNTLRTEAGIRKSLDIPMQYIALTLEFVLKRYGFEGEGLKELNTNHWINAIKESGYIDSELHQILK